MDITEIRQLLTNSLDEAELIGPNGSCGIHVTFRSTVNRTAVLIIVYPNNTFMVGRSVTAGEHDFHYVADAYARASTFLRTAQLRIG